MGNPARQHHGGLRLYQHMATGNGFAVHPNPVLLGYDIANQI
jgi:hypothetical protein